MPDPERERGRDRERERLAARRIARQIASIPERDDLRAYLFRAGRRVSVTWTAWGGRVLRVVWTPDLTTVDRIELGKATECRVVANDLVGDVRAGIDWLERKGKGR